MWGRVGLRLAFLSALAISVPAWADSYRFEIDIGDGSLSTSLQDLARQTGIELLFDRGIVGDRRSPGLRGRLTPQVALLRLLNGTDLSMRRAASGAWVIERRSALGEAPAAQDLAVPEILVIGRRTQDVDIRRRENDIQPYQVATREQIVRAHRDDLDQYFRSRVTPNTQVLPPSLLQRGATNSQIDLRGLGSGQTLILVDGRRLPGIPQVSLDFLQPDLNAIPLHAIERVETLTGTAGGIYGFGALGGVVNVVLRRDYRGLELHATTGISARGDARRLNLEGGFGFSPDQGRTDVTAYVSQSWEQALLQRQRNYVLRSREVFNRNAPDRLPSSRYQSNSVGVFDDSGSDLVFKPEYGGGSLGSGYSFLPRGFSGTPADLVAALTRHAGQVDLHPSIEQGASDLGSTPTTTSAILNIRHRFGGGVEAYADALILRNRGRFDSRQSEGSVVLFPDSPINPFQNIVWVNFPVSTESSSSRTRFSSDRYTFGLIVPLPFAWKATAEATFGAVHSDSAVADVGRYVGPIIADGSESAGFNPFGNWDAFQRSLAAYQYDVSQTIPSYNRYREQSLRLAGPTFHTAAGAATLTLLLQRRPERVPVFTSTYTSNFYDPPTDYTHYGRRTNTTRSVYAELSAPLIREDASLPLFKGLTVQLAVRHDDQKVMFSRDEAVPGLPGVTRTRFAGTTYTAGAKFLPLPWLMLRGSYATGQQPPPLQGLVDDRSVEYRAFLPDPKRGNTYFSDDGFYVVKQYGSPDLKTLRASTLALGMVLNPGGQGGPRASLDYSRIRRAREYVTILEDDVLAHEDLWPERVTREPLTDADRAKGYTGGLITVIDARAMNNGRLDVESLDARLDWTFPFAGGALHLYGSATAQLRNDQKEVLEPRRKKIGFFDGPLKWRSNGGVEWTIGGTMVGANAQYFSKYRLDAFEYPDIDPTSAIEQGSKYIKAQLYIDLYASQRIPLRWGGRDHDASIDFGIANVFDRAPPYIASAEVYGLMYSLYGDPRRRRFELTLNASF